jgi:hypothetical protein
MTGTTFSGFAFTNYVDSKKASMTTDGNISEMYAVTDGYPSFEKIGFNYPKTSTSLFYKTPDDPDPLWGWDARYAWAQTKNQEPWQYQHRFKLHLAKRDPSVPLTDLPPLPPGKEPLDVIADYLRQISKFAMKTLKEKKLSDFKMKDVRWCLTIPAQWTQAARAAMIQAAEKAGMIRLPSSPDNGGSEFPLLLVLEPEAASVFCFNKVLNSAAAQKMYVIMDK